MHFEYLISLAAIVTANSASAVRTRQLYESRNGTVFENVLVRPNGRLLLSTFDQARMYTLDPASNNTEAKVIAQFPNVTALTGSARIGKEKYAVAGGVLNQTALSFDPSATRIFTISFAPGKGCASSSDVAVIESSIEVPGNPGGINGLTSLPAFPHVVLGADHVEGRVYRINTLSEKVDVAFQDDLLMGTTDPDAPLPLGLNGIRVAGDYLYWTNSQAGMYGRVPIASNGDQLGPVEVIATLQRSATASVWDDFAITEDGVAYMTLHPNSLQQIDPDGTQTLLVGGEAVSDSELLREPTSVALRADGRALYVTTAGTGTGLGGQIVEVVL